MLAMWVKVRVKPEGRERFLKAIEVDALGSEGDEPGCMRFNVLQDGQDQNVYYFYEVYRDEAALEAHRATPHFARWRAKRREYGLVSAVLVHLTLPFAADSMWTRAAFIGSHWPSPVQFALRDFSLGRICLVSFAFNTGLVHGGILSACRKVI